MRAIGPNLDSPGRAARTRGPSDPGPNHAGQLVDTADPRTRAQVPGISDRHPGPSNPSPSRPGQLVDPVALGHGPDSPGRACRHHRPSEPALVTQNRWSTPTPSDPGPSCPEERFDPAGPRSRAGVSSDIWFTPLGLRHGPNSPGKPGRPRRTSDQNSCHRGELVDTTGHQPRARVTRDSWSTTDAWSTQRALGPKHEWPVTAGRPRGTSLPGPSRPGQLVDTSGPRTQLRVARESCSTPQVLGAGPESPGTSG